ncbi:MAG: Hint domain-containing protein, partial [Pseudomonadota bacterium]
GNPVTNASSVVVGDVYRFQGGAVSNTLIINDTGTTGDEDLFEDAFNDTDLQDQTVEVAVPDLNAAAGDPLHLESILTFQEENLDGTPTGRTVQVLIINNTNIGPNFSGEYFIPLSPLNPGLQYELTNADIDPTPINYETLPCFVDGVMIETPDGARAVETLREGDLVLTRDHGAVPLMWRGERRAHYLADQAPICFAAGAIGNPVELRVSPQHRLVMSGQEPQLLFGLSECLVAAKDFLGRPGVRRAEAGEYGYHHLLFEQHEIIKANGVWTESLLLGDVSSAGFGPAAEAVIRAKHPGEMEPAMPVLSSFEGKVVSGGDRAVA